jgi:hypothetical protein
VTIQKLFAEPGDASSMLDAPRTAEITSAMAVRRARIMYLFECFNERQFDVMLDNYAEDIAFTSPSLVAGDDPHSSGAGKVAILERLCLFREKHGRLQIVDAFANGDDVSVITTSETGRRFHFAIETQAGEFVSRLFVFQVG